MIYDTRRYISFSEPEKSENLQVEVPAYSEIILSCVSFRNNEINFS
jgi:hypothetical protein